MEVDRYRNNTTRHLNEINMITLMCAQIANNTLFNIHTASLDEDRVWSLITCIFTHYFIIL